MAFVKVATVAEVQEGQARQVTVHGRKIALFHAAGTFYALDDTCPHRGAPLWEGTVLGKEVTCPWHGARFALEDGAALCPPARSGVTRYPVEVVGDEVRVDVPD